jgi:hypothetical protein
VGGGGAGAAAAGGGGGAGAGAARVADSHGSSHQPEQLNGDVLIGEAALRLRLLRGLGWAAAALPEAAWRRATSKGARGALLEALLAEAHGAHGP